MHELGITQLITKTVVENAMRVGATGVVSVLLQVGEMRHWEQNWVQFYFDKCAEGTIAEGARIELETVPIVYECTACGEPYRHDTDLGEHAPCPSCGSKVREMICGAELSIKSIEILEESE